MKTTLQFKDIQIFSESVLSDPKEAIIDWDFNIVKSESNINFQYVINKIEIEYEDDVIEYINDPEVKIYFNGSLEKAIAEGLATDHLIVDFTEDEVEVTIYIGKVDR
tara:strand:+ start:578 stop:898 length:321 start_codon:yes stop_codon:yes gene_type:complete